jgi:hypothetical protein
MKMNVQLLLDPLPTSLRMLWLSMRACNPTYEERHEKARGGADNRRKRCELLLAI